MKTSERASNWNRDFGLVAQATACTLVLALSVSMLAFGGLIAAGLVHLG